MNRVALIITLTFAVPLSAQFPPEVWIVEFEPTPILIPVPCVEMPPARKHTTAKIALNSNPILRWNDAALEAIRAERPAPPVAARKLALMHIAIYDALNSLRGQYQLFLVRVSVAPENANEEAVIVAAAYRSLVSLFPTQARRFDQVFDEATATIPNNNARQAGFDLGQSVAEKVLALRGDVRTTTRTSYSISGAFGRWQPTPPDFRPPVLPEFANAKMLAIKDATPFRPKGPPSYTSEEFIASFKEVRELGGIASLKRTAEQTEIARFWADGDGTATPPGHWNRIAQTISEQRRLTLMDNARLFAMLNVALADAAIACWECKYKFDVWRPVTAIREAHRLNNPDLIADRRWTPLLTTPAFPSYTSGHSTFSGAAAAFSPVSSPTTPFHSHQHRMICPA